MLTPGWTARLQTIFGVPLQEVTEEHLKRLVDDGMREHSDLDFKQRTYGSTDAERRELAADIAQFANDRGGVIVIGVREDKEVAVELKAMPLDAKECDRMQSIAADRVVPYAQFEPLPIRSEEDEQGGYYLLIVPPSPDRPHAVRNGKDLRYPRRNGTQKRWLAESEIADAYRDRFTRASADVDRVDRLVQEGLDRSERNENFPHLVVGLVPSQSASFQVDAGSMEMLEQWARRTPHLNGENLFSGPFENGPVTAGVGVRRVLLGTSVGYRLDTAYGLMEVHADGATFASRDIPTAPPSHLPPPGGNGADRAKIYRAGLDIVCRGLPARRRKRRPRGWCLRRLCRDRRAAR